MFYHFVARTREENPFTQPQKADWMWQRLKPAFPQTLAAVLMPNHLHVVLKSDTPLAVRSSLARILGRFVSVFGESGPYWQPVPEPGLIVDPNKLRRNLRYVLLNPCRARLCADPLEWQWSTYRGSVGGVEDPWVAPRDFAAAFGGDSEGERSLSSIHRYITSDPSVGVLGSLFPRAALPSTTPQRSLAEIAAAACSATEEWRGMEALRERKSKTRSVFVRLACQQGWEDVGALSRFMGVSRSTIWALVQREKGKECRSAALCLGDQRFLKVCDRTSWTFRPGSVVANRL